MYFLSVTYIRGKKKIGVIAYQRIKSSYFFNITPSMFLLIQLSILHICWCLFIYYGDFS